MNSQLQNRLYDVPQDVLNHIHVTLGGLDNTSVDGCQRAKNLLRTKKVTYGQLKRIIHDMKNFDHESEPYKYNLYGGDLMEKWANTFLDGERTQVKNIKKGRQVANNIGQIGGIRKNGFLKSHTKKDSNSIPANMLKSNSDKTSVSSISNLGIFEEVERIKELLK
jgi:hypothetical protein